jgi:hypothetical protein
MYDISYDRQCDRQRIFNNQLYKFRVFWLTNLAIPLYFAKMLSIKISNLILQNPNILRLLQSKFSHHVKSMSDYG